MGPFPHNAPKAQISTANPAGTDGFEFVEFAHPQPEQLDALFEEVLEQNNVWQQAVQKICSIDLKKEEPGLLLFCAEHGILLETYDAETLRNLDGEFTASAFVSQVTGVDNVCERSAMAGSQNGKILISKMAKNGVTAAFVLDEVKISF